MGSPFLSPPMRPPDEGWLDSLFRRFAPDYANPDDHVQDPRAFGPEPDEWAGVHERAMAAAAADEERMAAEKEARDAEERAALSRRLGYGDAPVAPDELLGVATDLPGGGWDQAAAEAAPPSYGGSGSSGTAAPVRPPAIQGPPESLAYGTEIDPGFMGSGDPGVPPPQPIRRFEGPGGTGWMSEDGSIRAWMGGGRPSQEDARAILARGAFNAPPAPPPQGPPQPTTVTSARFDPAKEKFVPLGDPDPKSLAGVRESYQAVPNDPWADRQTRMRREEQDLELEKMRQAVQDPYGKERFEAEQRRGDIIKRGEIERMNEQERRQAFAQSIGQIDEEAQAAISALERSQFKDKQARIDAVRQRAEAAKDNQRQAFGIGARLGSSELYKREPTY